MKGTFMQEELSNIKAFELATVDNLKGKIIICPHCRVEICKFIKDCKRGTTITKDLVKFYKGQGSEGMKSHCNQCGKAYFATHVYTKDLGWV